MFVLDRILPLLELSVISLCLLSLQFFLGGKGGMGREMHKDQLLHLAVTQKSLQTNLHAMPEHMSFPLRALCK